MQLCQRETKAREETNLVSSVVSQARLLNWCAMVRDVNIFKLIRNFEFLELNICQSLIEIVDDFSWIFNPN